MKNMFKLIALTLAVSLGAGSLTAATADPLSKTDRASLEAAARHKAARDNYALLQAVRCNNLAGVVAALDRGANVNAVAWDGWTALHFAALHGYEDVLELLLNRGANVNAQSEYGKTALHFATYNMQHAEIVVPLLLARPKIDVNVRDRDGCTALHSAVSAENIEIIELLLNAGANVNAQSVYGCTALHYATRNMQHAEIVVLLLLARPEIDVNVQDKYGVTASDAARRDGRTEIVILIENYLAQEARWSTLRRTWVGLLVAQQALDAK